MQRRSKCPISFALDIFGDRWSLLLIRDLVFADKKTYGDFLKSEEGMATNILANRLRTLEKNGVLSKTQSTDDRRKEVYSLTKKGVDLIPILMEIMHWSAKHDPDTIASKEFIAQTRKMHSTVVRRMKKSRS